MLPDKYLDLKEAIISAGYEEEITWAETVKPPESPLTFFLEYAWVVINSGMKNQVARTIWLRVHGALLKGRHISTVFKHPGKSNAIQTAWENQEKLFNEYLVQPPEWKIVWLEKLPWIGPITKYHLARNLGIDVCKPDRHLMRIASRYAKTPQELCSALARVTGDRIGTVDLVIWRAANLGMI
ncbi:MAG: hypothetical protein AB1424_01785 [Thermodesulfobacteriota bacterium]